MNIFITYNKYMFNFIDIYSFIPASGCVGMAPGTYNAVKTIQVVTGQWFFSEYSCFLYQ
jgi:hypothetical protein